jgi:metal-responsive CopG/Arc/MetJ family transcriptional regulator
MTVHTRTTRLSVTIEPELKATADEIARKRGITTSRLVSECLEDMVRRRKEQLLIEFYKTMSTEHREFAEKTAGLINKIASSWSESDNA